MIDDRAFLLIGKEGHDSGNLLGFLRSSARQFGQDAFLYKAPDDEIAVHALKRLPDVELEGELKRRQTPNRGLGQFHQSLIGEYCHLILRRGAVSLPLGRLAMTETGLEDDGKYRRLHAPLLFPSRSHSRFYYSSSCEGIVTIEVFPVGPFSCKHTRSYADCCVCAARAKLARLGDGCSRSERAVTIAQGKPPAAPAVSRQQVGTTASTQPKKSTRSCSPASASVLGCAGN